MKFLMSLGAILVLLPTLAVAQTLEEHKKAIYGAEFEKEVTYLDKDAIDKVLESIAPSIDASQAKSFIEWQEKGIEFRKKDCSERRTRCVAEAIKGGHRNEVAEAGRLYFCKTSRKMCATDWK